MAILKSSKYDPLRNFKFIVALPLDIIGYAAQSKLGFSKVSGLNLGTSDMIEYREGNQVISPRKLPGLNRYENIIFEQGRALNFATINILEVWREQVAWYKGGNGGIAPDGRYPSNFLMPLRKTILVTIMDREGEEAVTFSLFDVWPVSLKFSDLDAQDSGLFISTLELAVEGITTFSEIGLLGRGLRQIPAL